MADQPDPRLAALGLVPAPQDSPAPSPEESAPPWPPAAPPWPQAAAPWPPPSPAEDAPPVFTPGSLSQVIAAQKRQAVAREQAALPPKQRSADAKKRAKQEEDAAKKRAKEEAAAAKKYAKEAAAAAKRTKQQAPATTREGRPQLIGLEEVQQRATAVAGRVKQQAAALQERVPHQVVLQPLAPRPAAAAGPAVPGTILFRFPVRVRDSHTEDAPSWMPAVTLEFSAKPVGILRLLVGVLRVVVHVLRVALSRLLRFAIPRLLELFRRSHTLELRTDGVFIAGTSQGLPWHEVGAVTARQGAVCVEMAGRGAGTVDASFSFVPELHGVPEPSLAPEFAVIVLDASSGSQPRVESMRAVEEAVVQLKLRFQDLDDPYLPLFLVLPALFLTILVAALIPVIVALPFREGQSVPAGAFLLYPRIGSADPLVVLAAMLAGLLLGGIALRVAVGRSVPVWARGLLRGWGRESTADETPGARAKKQILIRLRRAAATLVLIQPLLAVGFAFAILVQLPHARERVLVDEAGLHMRGPFPPLDRDVPWSQVRSTKLLTGEHGGYGVSIRLEDGTEVTTEGHHFYGLSEYELHQFAQRQCERCPK